MARPQRLIVGNWKMHKTIPEARDFVERFAELLHGAPKVGSVHIVLAPPFTALSAVAASLAQNVSLPPVFLAAQDVFWEEIGAYTGEISALMLQDLGCRYVIVGHSERRRYFGETDAITGKKVLAAIRHGLRAILCVGETWDQREKGHTGPVLSRQLAESLSSIEKDQAGNVVIAYEPVWAIGSGNPATPAQTQESHQHIRSVITALWGQEAAETTPILYGGSVTPDNIGELLQTPEIDGALVGGACLDPVQFARIIGVARSIT
jgi:triosephosphate isomerase